MWKVILIFVSQLFNCVECDTSEDVKLNFTQIAEKCGHKCEEFDVVTEDNFILKIFHIRGDDTKPILLGHGILTTADGFITRGKSSIVIALAEQGYDVWALNVRGSIYGRKHLTLNPDTDKAFWDFSFHEMGVKDLAANIDFVLNKTNQSQLIYIGHSQGSQMSFALGSIKSEYNAKIKLYIALAPIAFLHNLQMPTVLLPMLWPLLKITLEAHGEEELLNRNWILTKAFRKLCLEKRIGYEICAERVMFPLMGPDPSELDPDFFPVFIGHYLSPTSRKNADHLTQIVMRRKFSLYDYGLGNIQVYGSLTPLDYPLEKISSPVVLISGENDKMSTIEDVKLLKSRLPNAVWYKINHRKMNHADFICGKNMEKYLFPILFDVLQYYTRS